MEQTATEVGVEAQPDGAFPPFATETFPSQLLWLAITFGLFYYLMSKIALPRISSILEMRKDRVASDLDEANRLDEEGKAAVAAYEQDVTEARNRGNVIAQSARDEAKAKADDARARAEADLSQRTADAEARIASVRNEAMAKVEEIAVETAEALVAELAPTGASRGEIEAAVSAARS